MKRKMLIVVSLFFLIFTSIGAPVSASSISNAPVPSEEEVLEVLDFLETIDFEKFNIPEPDAEFVVEALKSFEELNLDSVDVNNYQMNIRDQDAIGIMGLPPRVPTKDPFWRNFYVALVAFVGVTTAQAIVTNAVNNGVQSACNRYQNTWGVTGVCTTFGYKPQ